MKTLTRVIYCYICFAVSYFVSVRILKVLKDLPFEVKSVGYTVLHHYNKAADIQMAYFFVLLSSVLILTSHRFLEARLESKIEKLGGQLRFRFNGLTTQQWPLFRIFSELIDRSRQTLERNRYAQWTLFLSLLTIISAEHIHMPEVSDFYHFGEFVLPYFSYHEFYKLPYVDYVPAHGLLVNLLPAFLSQQFWGNVSLSGIVFFYGLIEFLVCFGVGLLLRKRIGEIGTLALLSLIPVSRGYLLVCCFIWVFAEDYENKSSKLWINYFVISGLLIWTEVVTGLGFTLAVGASLGLAFLRFGDFKKVRAKEFLICLPFIGIYLGSLLLYPQFKQMNRALIVSLLENSQVNLQAFGLPLLDSLHADSNSLFFYKYLFLVLVALGIVYFIKCFKRVGRSEFILLSSALIMMVLTIGYYFGRIDPGYLSRPGLLSSIFLFLIGCYFFKKFQFQMRGALGVSFVSIGLIVLASQYSWRFGLIELYRYPAQVQENPPKIDQLKQVVEKYGIGENEYLDLTNKNLNYFLLKKNPPFESGAFFNIVHKDAWARNLKALDKIRFVLVRGDDQWFDGVKPQHRSQELVDFLVHNKNFVVGGTGKYKFLYWNEIESVNLATEEQRKRDLFLN